MDGSGLSRAEHVSATLQQFKEGTWRRESRWLRSHGLGASASDLPEKFDDSESPIYADVIDGGIVMAAGHNAFRNGEHVQPAGSAGMW